MIVSNLGKVVGHIRQNINCYNLQSHKSTSYEIESVIGCISGIIHSRKIMQPHEELLRKKEKEKKVCCS